MKQKTIILILILFVAIVNTKAQSIFIYFTDGKISEYPLSEVRKITFSATDMILHKKDATTFTWAISDIQKYNYSETSSETEIKTIDALIYPNPSNGNFIINYQLKQKEFINISIISMDGKIIKNLLLENREQGYYSLHYANNLEEGIYLIKISSTNNFITKKLIILK